MPETIELHWKDDLGAPAKPGKYPVPGLRAPAEVTDAHINQVRLAGGDAVFVAQFYENHSGPRYVLTKKP